MNKIPWTLFSSGRDKESLTAIRRCLASGLTVRDMAQQITERYRSARPKVRLHLGRMLASVYDFDSHETAAECARMFGFELIEGLSVSQSIYLSLYSPGEKLYWEKEFSSRVTTWQPIVESFPADRWPMIVPSGADSNILTIDSEDNIYVTMNDDRSVTLFILNDWKCDILIDEEPMFNDPPLYFTELSHFVSPVFKLKIARRLLDYCLTSIGYPFINIRMKVIFTHPEAGLLNREEYDVGGGNHRMWEGIDVLMLRSILPAYAFSETRFFLWDDPESLQGNLYTALLHSMAAVSILYNYVRTKEQMLKINDSTLSSLCSKNEIFDKKR